MRNLFLLLFSANLLLHTNVGYACSCGFDYTALEQKIEKASFIALVKITAKEIVTISDEVKSKTKTPLVHEGIIKFSTVEHFKGPSVFTVIEYGVNTSCDMGIAVGEEWIFFAYYDSALKRYSVTACTPSSLYRNKQGEKRGAWNSGSDFINTLRKTSGIAVPAHKDGRIISYYPSGVTESESYYNNDKLHGERKVYYVNGILMKVENYNNGMPDGLQLSYSRSGQLLTTLNYKNNHIVYSAFWYDTALAERKNSMLLYNLTNKKDSIAPSRLQMKAEGWFDPNTGNRHSVVYTVAGLKEREFYTYNDGAERLSCEYDERGALTAETFTWQRNDITIEKKWDVKGQLVSEKRWEKGKLVKKE